MVVTKNMTEENKMVQYNDNSLLAEIANSNRQAYCSLDLSDENNKKLLLKISQNADDTVANILNKEFYLANVFIQRYDSINEDTGEVVTRNRTILIDKDGKSYASASKGLFNSLRNLIGIMGTPDTWESPLLVRVVEKGVKNGGKTYIIEPVI